MTPGDPGSVVIDEAWLAMTVKKGMKQLGKYLAKHAAFDQFYADLHSNEDALD